MSVAYDFTSDAIAPFTDGRYIVRFAESEADLDAVLRLRFEVFNLELGEGLANAYETGLDEDPFDAVCHHLIVETDDAEIVGTYRLQTAEMARRGFYSAAEFDLQPLASIIGGAVELGRACIRRDHRNRRVLYLLWKGLANYLVAHGKRYLFGCCSLTSQDPAEGVRALEFIRRNGYLHRTVRTAVKPGFVPPPAEAGCADSLPPLFRTYLRHGALVCGGPAMDRQFGTIDFLVLLDIRDMDERSRKLFFA
jgi:putative hemolysin